MEYKSNISQVLSNIEGKLKKASDVSKLNRTIGTYLKASNLRRIHNEGLAVNGSPIGSYSTKPLYVNPNKSPRSFPPKGKYGQVVFKNGNKHKTGYFNGYKGFRASIGREVGMVNLQLSGKLLKDWLMEQRGDNFVIGFGSEYGTNLSLGNEKRFAKQIWGISKQDYEQIEVIKKEFIKQALA